MNFRLACALLLATLLISSAAAPANAWWLFFKHKPGLFHHVPKKPRTLVGASVGLVPGMPPALVWKGEGKPRAAVLCLDELGF
jgi:hypothetical protein